MKSHPSNVSLHIYASEVGMTQPAQGQIWQKCTDQGGEAIGPVGYAQGSEVHGREAPEPLPMSSSETHGKLWIFAEL